MLLDVCFAWDYCFQEFVVIYHSLASFYGCTSCGLQWTEIVGQVLHSVFSDYCHQLYKINATLVLAISLQMDSRINKLYSL